MDIEFVRKQFPALDKDFIFMDNAGGSQILGKVIQRINGYLIHHNVQLGASYKVSKEAGEKLAWATKQIAKFINANRTEEVIIGSSSSMLFRILSLSISRKWQEGDEVIVTNTDHEANISPWIDLKEKGIKIKIWKANPETMELELSELKKLLSKKTKLVAVTHCSNILGTINPIKEITQMVHQNGSLICVDGVAYAPHRQIDVQDLDIDFYTFSWYKTYGPHLALMYGKYDLLLEMDGINHDFFKKDDIPYKFQPGNFNFELTYSLLGITEYFHEFYKQHFPEDKDSAVLMLKKSYEVIATHEQKLAKRLLDFLNEHQKVKIIGTPEADALKRVPTISFIHEDLKSNEIVEQIDDYRIGIRFGDFYAKKLVEDFDLTKNNGVVRISLVHYNTEEEVKRLIWALGKVI